MPASSVISYFQDARNNFDAVRPAPLCPAIGQSTGQCQNIHISTNCYYGYLGPKAIENSQNNTDCEMVDATYANEIEMPQTGSRKRSADNSDCPQSKRLKEEVQREKTNDPETKETTKVNTSTDYLLETLYWNIHGGHIYQLQ